MTRRGAVSLLLAVGAAGCASVEAETVVPLRALADGLWQVVGAAGDGGADDRGVISHGLVAVAGAEGWLIGSGPTPAFGRRLRATLDARWPGRTWTVVSAWAHPESVLGVAGLGPVRHVGHADVADQMAERCATCIVRLKQRLGVAAVDLGEGDPVRLPTQRLSGERGVLGPFDWWRLTRDDHSTTTVWAHRASAIVFAPGLLWGEGAPDGRDADLAALARATAALDALPGRPRPARWLGEQGGLAGDDAPRQVAQYWQALQQAVAQGLDDGDAGLDVPRTLPGVPMARTTDPRHALNWQRAWRQSEERWLQRSLR